MLIAENVALLKESNSIVDKLAAAMVMLALEILTVFEKGVWNMRFILKYTRFIFTDSVHLKLISNLCEKFKDFFYCHVWYTLFDVCL